jgi:GAF domain-containing protein
MESHSTEEENRPITLSESAQQGDRGLLYFVKRLNRNLDRDALVQQTIHQLRQHLQVDRVVLYYFYRPWKGRVTFESLSDDTLSIFGSTGPDECFNDQYAALYLEGRIRAIADIDCEPITPCHRDFLRNLQVRANLCAPVLTSRGLWGLLIAHHCKGPRPWSTADTATIQKSASILTTAPAICDSDITHDDQ